MGAGSSLFQGGTQSNITSGMSNSANRFASSTDPYVQAAQAAAAGNMYGAQQATAANRVNQSTPYANLQYQQTGTDAYGNPIWSANQSLNPAFQNTFSNLAQNVGQTTQNAFNPNNLPIKKVDRILKNDWGISTNIMDMDVKRIDLERTRMMDKDLIQYHTMLTYVAKARIKPWEKHDTFYYGTAKGLKQFCIYTKEPKERLVRGELKLIKQLDKRYDIHELEYLVYLSPGHRF